MNNNKICLGKMNGLNTMESRGLLLRLLKEEEINETAERARGVYMFTLFGICFHSSSGDLFS